MRGYLVLIGGERIQLPEPISYQVSHGTGQPCDSFTYTCPTGGLTRAQLDRAKNFTAVFRGETVFTGVVDEVLLSLGTGGYSLEVNGRGMGALLLDSQPGPVSFATARLRDIVEQFVTPYGIETGKIPDPGVVSGYTVSESASCWKALADFCTLSGAPSPRFDRGGRLVFGLDEGSSLSLRGVSGAVVTLRRYGVISSVYITGDSRLIYSQMGSELGVGIQKTAKTEAAALAKLNSGEQGYYTLTVTVPGAFLAWPGDLVSLELPELGVSGSYQVWEAVSWGDSSGRICRLTMKEI